MNAGFKTGEGGPLSFEDCRKTFTYALGRLTGAYANEKNLAEADRAAHDSWDALEKMRAAISTPQHQVDFKKYLNFLKDFFTKHRIPQELLFDPFGTNVDTNAEQN